MAVQESNGVSPAELNLRCLPRRPLDMVQQPREHAPDTPAYTKIAQEDLCSFIPINPGLCMMSVEKEL